MVIDKTASADSVKSAVQTKNGASDGVKGGGVFHVICRDSEGNIKWELEDHNLVVNVGLQDMNNKYFTGASYTAAWYMGLWGAAASNTPAAGDTMSSHAGWTEFTNYSSSTRPAITFDSATAANPSVITNSLSATAFVISGAGGTVGGAFITSDSTKNGTTGILFSGSDFQSPGDRVVVSGDVLSVTYTFTLSTGP